MLNNLLVILEFYDVNFMVILGKGGVMFGIMEVVMFFGLCYVSFE